jgi:Rap/ran-GAP
VIAISFVSSHAYTHTYTEESRHEQETQKHTHTHTHTHTYTHTHTHTHDSIFLVQPGTNSHNLTFAPQLAHRLEIMFHVSCYLPLQEHDTQRVERKRHLGNDIVVIVFLEKNASVGFSPLSIKSHFIHTYVVIQVDHHTQKDTFYRICVVSDETVHEVGVLLCGVEWWIGGV